MAMEIEPDNRHRHTIRDDSGGTGERVGKGPTLKFMGIGQTHPLTPLTFTQR